MKRFSFVDNGCPCEACERFYGSEFDPQWRETQRRRREYETSLERIRAEIDRHRLIQLQED